MQKHSKNFMSKLSEADKAEFDMSKSAFLFFAIAFLVMIAFSSCSRQTYCPKNNIGFWYKQQGTKMPKELKKNLRPRR